jgi:nucleoside-diphosphate-sugar epimerase
MLEHLKKDSSRPPRTVILGAGGFVGSAIVRCLEREKASVLALSSKDLDLLSEGATKRLEQSLHPGDSVIFVSGVAPCRDVATLMKNLQMVEAALPALERIAIEHLVYISSDAVYADGPGPITEESCASPSSLHGMMHHVRELMLVTSLQVPVAILRPSLIYGAADPHNGYGPNRFRRTAEQERKISLFGEGEEQRDHVIIDDVAEIVLRVATHRSRGVLNIATGRSVSFRHVADLVAGQHGPRVEIQTLPRGGPVTHRHFDVTALLKSFPTFRFTPVEEGIPRVHRQIVARSS